MKNIAPKRKFDWTFVLPILSILLVFFAGTLTIAYARQGRRLARVEEKYSTIPLRNDYRKQVVRKAPREIRQPRFYDDTSILYISGKCLYRMSIREGVPEVAFRGHQDDVAAFAVSPDGKRIVTTSSDGTLRLWEPRTGECLAVSEPLETRDQPTWTMLHEVVFHPDGRKVMTADMEGVKVWRARDLKRLSTEKSDIFYLCNGLLSPDWKTMVAPVRDTLEAFDVYRRTRKSYVETMHVAGETPLAYSPDGRHLLSFSYGASGMTLWRVLLRGDGKELGGDLLVGAQAPLLSAAFSPDGSHIVSAHADGTVHVWNAQRGAEREVLHWEDREIDGIASAPDADYILACSNKAGEYSLWGPFVWIL